MPPTGLPVSLTHLVPPEAGEGEKRILDWFSGTGITSVEHCFHAPRHPADPGALTAGSRAPCANEIPSSLPDILARSDMVIAYDLSTLLENLPEIEAAGKPAVLIRLADGPTEEPQASLPSKEAEPRARDHSGRHELRLRVLGQPSGAARALAADAIEVARALGVPITPIDSLEEADLVLVDVPSGVSFEGSIPHFLALVPVLREPYCELARLVAFWHECSPDPGDAGETSRLIQFYWSRIWSVARRDPSRSADRISRRSFPPRRPPEASNPLVRDFLSGRIEPMINRLFRNIVGDSHPHGLEEATTILRQKQALGLPNVARPDSRLVADPFALKFMIERIDHILLAIRQNRRDLAFQEIGLICMIFRRRRLAEACFAAACGSRVIDPRHALVIACDRFLPADRGGGLGLEVDPQCLPRFQDPESLRRATDAVDSWFGPDRAGEPMNVEGPRFCRWLDLTDLVPDMATAFEPTVCRERDGFFEQPPPARGARLQRRRISLAAEMCAARFPGDLVEIGANLGETTVQLAEIARRYARRVIVVDPWQPGGQGHGDADYDAFKSYTSQVEDVLDVVRASSLEKDVRAALKERKLCFAFVDGLHTYEACRSDILTVKHAHGLIAVDDLLWKNELSAAMIRGASLAGRIPLHYPLFREGYLVPKNGLRRNESAARAAARGTLG